MNIQKSEQKALKREMLGCPTSKVSTCSQRPSAVRGGKHARTANGLLISQVDNDTKFFCRQISHTNLPLCLSNTESKKTAGQKKDPARHLAQGLCLYIFLPHGGW